MVYLYCLWYVWNDVFSIVLVSYIYVSFVYFAFIVAMNDFLFVWTPGSLAVVKASANGDPNKTKQTNNSLKSNPSDKEP